MTQYKLFKELPEVVRGQGKVCTKCNKYLPLKSFAWNSGYYRPECLNCLRKIKYLVRDLRKVNPKPDKNYKCPICGTKAKINHTIQRKKDYWHLDHCHITKKFRAYLCPSCNSLLGFANDDISILEKAIRYLKGDKYGREEKNSNNNN